jgi:hypothetical protein
VWVNEVVEGALADHSVKAPGSKRQYLSDAAHQHYLVRREEQAADAQHLLRGLQAPSLAAVLLKLGGQPPGAAGDVERPAAGRQPLLQHHLIDAVEEKLAVPMWIELELVD